ncbi:unnamed protein product, partial [Choristocarpus tenellus]
GGGVRAAAGLGARAEAMDGVKLKQVVRVGVACLVGSPRWSGCVLVGVRKGSHGAGTLALPG